MGIPEIGLDYCDNADGSVSAQLTGYPDGEIWAENSSVLLHSTFCLFEQIHDIIEKNKQQGRTQGMIDLGIQGGWLDGRFTVRFLSLPGFGVSFSTPENFSQWLSIFVTVASGGSPQLTTHDCRLITHD